MKVIRAIWDYLRESWEGPDGKFSYKRACQFIFVQLLVYMVTHSFVRDAWTFYTFLTVAILYGFTARLINPRQVIAGLEAASKLRQNEKDFGMGMAPLDSTSPDDDGVLPLPERTDQSPA